MVKLQVSLFLWMAAGGVVRAQPGFIAGGRGVPGRTPALDASLFGGPGIGFPPLRSPGISRVPPSPSLSGLSSGAGAAVTLRKSFDNSGDGNFEWGFETSDGTRSEQVGTLKGPDAFNPEGVQSVQGSYSYISPEGIPISVSYIADENGFRAVGDHIPASAGNNNNALLQTSIRANSITRKNDLPLPVGAPAPGLELDLDPFQRPIPTRQFSPSPFLGGRNPAFFRPAQAQDNSNVQFLAEQERAGAGLVGYGNALSPFNNRFGFGRNGQNNGIPYDNSLFNGRLQNPALINRGRTPYNNPGLPPTLPRHGLGFRDRFYP